MLSKKSRNHGLIIIMILLVLVVSIIFLVKYITGNNNFFDVRFTTMVVTPKGSSTSNYTKATNNNNSSNFKFSGILREPKDKISYKITLQNLGTIDAEVESFTLPETWKDNNVKYKVEGINIGDKIVAGSNDKIEVTIVVEWLKDGNVTAEKEFEHIFNVNLIQKKNNNKKIIPTQEAIYTHIDINGNGIVDSAEQILFGTYPQTKVIDPELITILNNKSGSLPTKNKAWKSYKYYQGKGSSGTENNTKDYMWYQDVEENGEKYRGIYFTSYRPHATYLTPTTNNSYQDENGYNTDTIYWFKYDDILWDVGKNEDGEITLITHSILDSKEFYITYDEIREDNEKTIYPNNYQYSTIRKWLNDTFYNTAFINANKKVILTSEVNNSGATTDIVDNIYVSEDTMDKIFLLSFQNINENLTSYNINKIKQGSDYAKAQGLYTYLDNSYYLLRSPIATNNSYVYYVYDTGEINNSSVESTNYGVVATLKIKF